MTFSVPSWISEFAVAASILVTLVSCGSSGAPPDPSGPAVSRTSAKIQWEPPINRVDGSLLIDLAGFKVYYADGSGDLSRVVDVGLATYLTVTGLPPRTYYFSVTAYDATGQESDPSNTISVTFN